MQNTFPPPHKKGLDAPQHAVRKRLSRENRTDGPRLPTESSSAHGRLTYIFRAEISTKNDRTCSRFWFLADVSGPSHIAIRLRSDSPWSDVQIHNVRDESKTSARNRRHGCTRKCSERFNKPRTTLTRS